MKEKWRKRDNHPIAGSKMERRQKKQKQIIKYFLRQFWAQKRFFGPPPLLAFSCGK